MRIGYGRVSTRDLHPEAQHDALTASAATVGQIAAEFGVTRPTIYRHLDKPTS
ncbi:ArsR family transcriptional regulator [Nocardia tengchongensis]|uniref:ArsR family transcriptional regulator n=1 Tax=Nocardia tengchongensis TaxID=2055889 RepID=UPI003654C0C1